MWTSSKLIELSEARRRREATIIMKGRLASSLYIMVITLIVVIGLNLPSDQRNHIMTVDAVLFPVSKSLVRLEYAYVIVANQTIFLINLTQKFKLIPTL